MSTPTKRELVLPSGPRPVTDLEARELFVKLPGGLQMAIAGQAVVLRTTWEKVFRLWHKYENYKQTWQEFLQHHRSELFLLSPKMTVDELLAKFPKLPLRENCMTDKVCPYCGNRDWLRIEMTSIFVMSDEGTEEYGDTDYTDESYAACADSAGCNFAGRVVDFSFDGLDEAIHEKTSHTPPATVSPED
jgi:hypothetical protein